MTRITDVSRLESQFLGERSKSIDIHGRHSLSGCLCQLPGGAHPMLQREESSRKLTLLLLSPPSGENRAQRMDSHQKGMLNRKWAPGVEGPTQPDPTNSGNRSPRRGLGFVLALSPGSWDLGARRSSSCRGAFD